MIKIVEDILNEREIIRMDKMLPLSVGIIKDGDCKFNGDVVLRTASTSYVEIMNLSNTEEGGGWSNSIGVDIPVQVEMLEPGEEIIICISNDEYYGARRNKNVERIKQRRG